MHAGKITILSILLFGFISLTGDIIYEGARGIVPPFLKSFGASAFTVGAILGLGEFLSYVSRMIFGTFLDKTKAYWDFFIGGYAFLIVVPMLALATGWQIAVIFILIERLAKAMRTPARDVLFSFVSKEIGTGKAFGLHEFLDQIGAIIGPAIVATILLTFGGRFSTAFSILLIPYFVLIALILATYIKLKSHVSQIINLNEAISSAKVPKRVVGYSIAVALNSLGLVPIALILYQGSLFALPWIIALIYLATQATDAISAPISGYFYDRIGMKFLYLPFVLSIFPSILIFFKGIEYIIVSALIFGIILGMHESIYRAAIADMTPVKARGSAYGLFYALYGCSFLAGGSIFGFFLDKDLFLHAVLYTIVIQMLAISMLRRSIYSE